jgi:hypothetical protein
VGLVRNNNESLEVHFLEHMWDWLEITMSHLKYLFKNTCGTG